MTRELDITGQRFGKLVAIKKDHAVWDKEKRKSRNFWLFKCDCGKEKVIDKYSVIRGLTTSCGCYANEQRIKKNTKHGLFNTEKRLYGCWQDMKNRCYNSHREKYKIYGARGISVCKEWKDDFKAFYDWALSNGYKENLTLDRINVNGNYCPENCRWATYKEQANNTRTNKKITINGITKNLCQWLSEYNISSGSYYNKIRHGLTDEQIFMEV